MYLITELRHLFRLEHRVHNRGGGLPQGSQGMPEPALHLSHLLADLLLHFPQCQEALVEVHFDMVHCLVQYQHLVPFGFYCAALCLHGAQTEAAFLIEVQKKIAHAW